MIHDILFTPCGSGWVHQHYTVSGMTDAGNAWLNHYCVSRMAYSPSDRQNLAAAAERCGLVVFVAWENVVVTLAQEMEHTDATV